VIRTQFLETIVDIVFQNEVVEFLLLLGDRNLTPATLLSAGLRNFIKEPFMTFFPDIITPLMFW
jgi:hypothetical protein